MSTPPKPYTEEEKQDLLEAYRIEQKRQYAERQSVKYGRMAELMLDEGNKKEYKIKKEQWVEQTLRNNSEYFLAKEKGRKIPESIEKVIEDVKVKDRIKNVAKVGKSGKINLQLFANKMPEEKFTQYSLNPLKAPDKAKAFKNALGYTIDNFEDLRQNILDNLIEDNFTEKGDNGYGMRYEQILELIGPNGKKAKVLTAWIQEGNDKRLVSVYVDR